MSRPVETYPVESNDSHVGTHAILAALQGENDGDPMVAAAIHATRGRLTDHMAISRYLRGSPNAARPILPVRSTP
jgi:hypothetical protein